MVLLLAEVGREWSTLMRFIRPGGRLRRQIKLERDLEDDVSLEEKLRTTARSVSGDSLIVDVAEMHPRGFAAAAGAGAGAGNLAGSSVTDSSVGSMLGTAGGAAAGMAGAAAARGLPMRVCVAVSPDKVHLLEIRNKLGYDDLALLVSLERSIVEVETHGRVFNRVVVLRDSASGETYELEAPRMGPFKSKDLVALLEENLESASWSSEEGTE